MTKREPRMSEPSTVITASVPNLPCPSCGANLLAEGFYNSRTEMHLLREVNHTFVVKEYLYIKHDEDNYESVDHVCDLEAFCRTCDQRLPWTLPEIRGLDGISLSQADAAIAKLLNEHIDLFPSN
jgi:hypothetical protein